jgi:hypothetical protein
MLKYVAVNWVFQTWWDNHDLWDGSALYDDLIGAKTNAELDYIADTYDWVADPILTWLPIGKDMWHLYDEGEATGVGIQLRSVLGLKKVV